MKTIMLVCLYFLSTMVSADCRKESAEGPFIFSDDFRWDYSLPELKSKFNEMYSSLKRLKNRAFINEKKQIVLPFNAHQGGAIVVSDQFVQAVASHIQQGLEKGIVDAVFFPDMGHSHIFIPQEKYNKIYSNIEAKQFNILYEKLFADADIKILYHTAEQLKTLEDGKPVEDPATRHRLQTRNLVGPNDAKPIFTIQNPDSAANTARDLPGHFYWGAGFNFSANANGCFSYQANGQIYYFDLSMYDLESSDTGGGF